jgi:hypothetical protein
MYSVRVFLGQMEGSYGRDMNPTEYVCDSVEWPAGKLDGHPKTS